MLTLCMLFFLLQVGPGDTLMGIAKTFQCCCTPTDIAVTTGWGGEFPLHIVPRRSFVAS